jgi:hypothetical protein
MLYATLLMFRPQTLPPAVNMGVENLIRLLQTVPSIHRASDSEILPRQVHPQAVTV